MSTVGEGRVWRQVAGGVALSVRLTPRAARDAIEGVETRSDGAAVLKARVRAVPEAGAANAALELLIAEWLGLARSAVSVAAGAKSRIKTVKVAGEPEGVARLIEQRLVRRGSGRGET